MSKRKPLPEAVKNLDPALCRHWSRPRAGSAFAVVVHACGHWRTANHLYDEDAREHERRGAAQTCAECATPNWQRFGRRRGIHPAAAQAYWYCDRANIDLNGLGASWVDPLARLLAGLGGRATREQVLGMTRGYGDPITPRVWGRLSGALCRAGCLCIDHNAGGRGLSTYQWTGHFARSVVGGVGST